MSLWLSQRPAEGVPAWLPKPVAATLSDHGPFQLHPLASKFPPPRGPGPCGDLWGCGGVQGGLRPQHAGVSMLPHGRSPRVRCPGGFSPSAVTPSARVSVFTSGFAPHPAAASSSCPPWLLLQASRGHAAVSCLAAPSSWSPRCRQPLGRASAVFIPDHTHSARPAAVPPARHPTRPAAGQASERGPWRLWTG